ncbi:putative Magnetosome protein MamD [Gammaproteobacteria bacterium]
MASETVILKLSGATQAAQVPMLSGQSFVVGKTVAAGNGLSNWLFLHPLSCAGSACGPSGGMVALKLEGAQQAGLLSSMVGQTVTVGQSPVGAATANSWLVLHPYMGGAVAGKGMTTVGMVAKGGGLQKVAAIRAVEAAEIEGVKGAATTGTIKGTAGKAALAGKNAATTVAVKGTAGKGTATAVGSLTKGNAIVTGQSMLMGGTKTATGATGIATGGGTIWTGSGTKLGLGLGLGSLGPLLLVAVASAIGVGIYSYMQRPAAENEIAESVS